MLTESQGLFCFSPHPTSKWAGGAQEIRKETQPGQSTPTDHRDILYHMASCSVQEVGESKGRRGLKSRENIWHNLRKLGEVTLVQFFIFSCQFSNEDNKVASLDVMKKEILKGFPVHPLASEQNPLYLIISF